MGVGLRKILCLKYHNSQGSLNLQRICFYSEIWPCRGGTWKASYLTWRMHFEMVGKTSWWHFFLKAVTYPKPMPNVRRMREEFNWPTGCFVKILTLFHAILPTLMHISFINIFWKIIPLELEDNAALLIAYVFRHLSNISSQSATTPSFPPVTKPCTNTVWKMYLNTNVLH